MSAVLLKKGDKVILLYVISILQQNGSLSKASQMVFSIAADSSFTSVILSWMAHTGVTLPFFCF